MLGVAFQSDQGDHYHRATSASSGKGRMTGRRRSGQTMVILALSLISYVGLFPFLFMLMTSFKTNQQYYGTFWRPTLPLHLENYSIAWKQIQPYFVTSLTVAAASIVGTLVLCTVDAFVFARYEFFGRKVLFAIVALLLMVPGISSLIPLFVLMRDLGILNTRLDLVLPHVAGGAVLGTLLMKTFVEQIPRELLDAARVDGASAPRMFRSIMIPLSLPVVGTISPRHRHRRVERLLLATAHHRRQQSAQRVSGPAVLPDPERHRVRTAVRRLRPGQRPSPTTLPVHVEVLTRWPARRLPSSGR
jgi:multiple sugar transport system permease protein